VHFVAYNLNVTQLIGANRAMFFLDLDF